MTDFEQIPEMPRLEPGIQLLQTDGDLAPIKPLQSLVIDTLLLDDAGGHAVWIDALDRARTDTMSSLAPSQRVLDRVHLARGFTPYQHAAAIESIFEMLQSESGHGDIDPADVSLLVCPAVDALYREDDIRQGIAEELLYRVLARLSTIARTLEIPVLVSRVRDDELATPFETAADTTITCRETDLGIWFEADQVETLFYPLENGYVQTTLAYWAEILQARQPLYERYSIGTPQPITPSVLEG